MICNNCGKSLPKEGAICKFCGAMMDIDQINKQKMMRDPSSSYQTKLISDLYNVDKSNIYKKEPIKENKLLGALVIIIILLFLIFLVILTNIG